MDRKEIKELAKSKIKGNLWNLLWPALAIGVVEGLLSYIFTPKASIDAATGTVNYANMGVGNAILILLVGIICGIAMVAYKKYVINFARDGKCEFKDILNCMKEKWLNIILAEILVGILVFLASLLLVVPGIILSFAYSMVTYLVVDTNLSATDAMKESRRMMKGYKMDYFVFCLSFIGWLILVPFTIGLLLIWLYPYMEVAQAIYYDKLKEKTKTA